MYTVKNFRTKKALKEAVERGEKIRLFAPGLGRPKENGIEFVEGPHYPEPHRWYAQVEMKDGIVVKVKNPGTNWHVDRASDLKYLRKGIKSPGFRGELAGMIQENEYAAEESRKRGMNPRRQLSVFDKHQLAIARKTLTYSGAGAKIMGGPTKAEAREIIKRLTGRTPKENPVKKQKNMLLDILPAFAIGTVLVSILAYIGRRATEG